MIIGAHVVLYTSDPEADRAFFRDVLGFAWVDAGHGWLIFKLPPAEAAMHPSDGGPAPGYPEFYLMCDDLQATIESLAASNVVCAAIDRARWGMKTTIRLPSGTTIGLYQPTHPTALAL
jgi:catechol 2,3-dioxygenase-like lactoylglutathione lyase family enzyme